MEEFFEKHGESLDLANLFTLLKILGGAPLQNPLQVPLQVPLERAIPALRSA
jgi:hypothetical protein